MGCTRSARLTPTATGSFGRPLQPPTEENEVSEVAVDSGPVVVTTTTTTTDVQAETGTVSMSRPTPTTSYTNTDLTTTPDVHSPLALRHHFTEPVSEGEEDKATAIA